MPKNQDKLPTDKSDSNNRTALTNGDLALKKKKNYKKRHITDDSDARPKKKARTVKILLEEKRVVDSKYCSNYKKKFYRIIHVGVFTAETLLLKYQPTLHSKVFKSLLFLIHSSSELCSVKINFLPCIVFTDDENVSGSVGKSVENYYSSINDVIESVVNAARNHSEDSRDSSSSCSETKSIGRFGFPFTCVRVFMCKFAACCR